VKNNRKLFIPAILIAAAAALILYAVFGIQNQRPPGMNGERPGPGPGNDEGSAGIFRTLGTIAVFCTAVSYAWFRLKSKRRSASAIVRRGVKLFYAVHTYTGYLALILIAVHGTYFLIKGMHQDSILSGIAAFSLLLSVGVYGFLIKRVRNKSMRTVHWGLGTAFLAAGLVHAGGSAIAAVLSVIGLWILVWLLERLELKREDEKV
jgi:hypothetical protein